MSKNRLFYTSNRDEQLRFRINSGIDTFFHYSWSGISKLMGGVAVVMKWSGRGISKLPDRVGVGVVFFNTDLTSVDFMACQREQKKSIVKTDMHAYGIYDIIKRSTNG